MTLRANAGRLLVHQVASAVCKEVVELARGFRGPGALTRGDQMARASFSVTSNIAEACGRGTVQEFRQFVGYAKGSAHELRSQVQLCKRLDPLSARGLHLLEGRVTLVIKMLDRLQRHPPPAV